MGGMNIDRLKAVAEKSVERTADHWYEVRELKEAKFPAHDCFPEEGFHPGDAEFIAAADPVTILALIAKVKRYADRWLEIDEQLTAAEELIAAQREALTWADKCIIRTGLHSMHHEAAPVVWVRTSDAALARHTAYRKEYPTDA